MLSITGTVAHIDRAVRSEASEYTEEKLAGFFHGISPYGTESDQREKVHCIIGTVYWRYSTGWN